MGADHLIGSRAHADAQRKIAGINMRATNPKLLFMEGLLVRWDFLAYKDTLVMGLGFNKKRDRDSSPHWKFTRDRSILSLMPRPRKPGKNNRKLKSPKAPVRNADPSLEATARTGRSLARDLVMGLVVCFLFFAAIETVLRIAGVPARDPGDDPFVGFSGTQPLFAGGERHRVHCSGQTEVLQPGVVSR